MENDHNFDQMALEYLMPGADMEDPENQRFAKASLNLLRLTRMMQNQNTQQVMQEIGGLKSSLQEQAFWSQHGVDQRVVRQYEEKVPGFAGLPPQSKAMILQLTAQQSGQQAPGQGAGQQQGSAGHPNFGGGAGMAVEPGVSAPGGPGHGGQGADPGAQFRRYQDLSGPDKQRVLEQMILQGKL